MPHLRLNQRILSCRFTHLATDRIARQRWGKSWRLKPRPDDAPLVVIDTIKNAIRIVAQETHPTLEGIQIGQSLSDARAINPAIDCVHHDANADAQLLHKLARWCERYTPIVALSGSDGLFLDITGCTHLFGGEESLIEDISKRLTAQGFSVKIAIADTSGAAWAMTHFSAHLIAPPSQHKELLCPMPLSALRLDEASVRELNRVGFKTVGALLDLPRAPIASRFGSNVLRRLDQALGTEDEVISPLSPVATLVHEKRFFEPIAYEDDIKAAILLLAEQLVESLQTRGLGMRQCRLELFRADGEVVFLTVEASTPLRDALRIKRLFDERLASLHDEFDAGFGFDIIRLSVLRADQLDETQEDLVDKQTSQQTKSDLVDRLSARLGAHHVKTYQSADTHIPERQSVLVPALYHQSQAAVLAVAQEGEEAARRPIILLERPELADVMAQVPEGPPLRFRWRKVRYEVAKAEGPERIACEWWKDGRAARTRDYFRVETTDGYRLWLFRHGLYERETNAPKWYVQGMFA